MYYNRFQQGDYVKYVGERFAKELNGKLGTICGRVAGSQSGVVVDFGDDSFVMDEMNHLAPAVFKPKVEGEEKEEKKQPEVQKRKGVRKGRGQEADAE